MIAKQIAFFEPYFGGSHKAFLKGLCQTLDCNFTLHTLPARKWKWRMRLAAPYFAEQVRTGSIDLHGAEAILCSPFLDVAAFKGLLPQECSKIPIYCYFHENQFAYPVQVVDERDCHFGLTNLTTALGSDRIAFNSRYNLESFIEGCSQLQKMIYDMEIAGQEESIRQKSTILYPGIDFSGIDECPRESLGDGVPVILWNHRWEHDKNPELFFRTLFSLRQKGVKFRLTVIGQAFRQVPEIFIQAKEILADRLLQFGYVPDRREYIKLLKQADIVVSTANHEFFGIAVIEAVRAGACPLLPNRMSYPELFDTDFLYDDDCLEQKLLYCLQNRRISEQDARQMTERFSWTALKPSYERWLCADS